MPTLTNFNVNKIDGTPTHTDEFKGKVRLIVNVASKCGLTKQYEGLEDMYEKYKDSGLVVMGFPANEFAHQEPGTNTEIADFCRSTYGVKFPMYSKIVVKGQGQHPLYKSLTEAIPTATPKNGGVLKDKLKEKGLLSGSESDITWNFEKFLIGRNNEVLARFAPDVEPQDPVLVKAVENALGD
jgi:glutathione peroxidase